MSEIKFKILNKSKEGILLSAKKGTEPVRMGWDEFKKYYTVKDKVWAIPTEECIKKIEEIEDHINNAAVAFFISGGNTDEVKDLGALASFGAEMETIQKLVGCTGMEAIQLVCSRVDMIRNFGSPKPKKNFKKKTDNKPKKGEPQMVKRLNATTSPILADNPALLALKEELKKK